MAQFVNLIAHFMTDQSATESSVAAGHETGPIVAKAGKYYRVTGMIMGVVMIGYGIWSIRDGFFAWPEQTQREQAAGQKPSHNHLSILLNQVLGVVLPPAGVALLIWRLYNSRGTIRLENETIHAPGHPPIPLDSITALDRSRWERKGIAYVSYEIPGGATGNLKLDDFVYERAAIDRIYERLEKTLSTEAEAEPKL